MARKKSKTQKKKIVSTEKENRELPTEEETRKSLKAHLLRSAPFFLLALLFVFYFNRAGLLTQLETTVLDTQMRLDVPPKESPVVIVNIYQEDFDNFFQGKTRPLNPPKLHELITAVSKGKPCLIAVDIDTSFSEFSQEKGFNVSYEWSPVVWAREASEITDVNQKLIPLDVLGGQNQFNDKSGMPLSINDSSGITRRYKRLIETTKGNLPSLAWAVFREGKERKCSGISFPELQATTTPLLIRYSRGIEGIGRNKFSASHIIKLAENPDWQNNELIKDKIVLIGGTYLGDDIHRTPLGEMSGVEITANVIETELRGGGIKPPGFITIALLSLFDGLLLIGLFHVFTWKRAFLYSIPLIIILSLLCSLIAYYSFAHWALFLLIMFGVLLAEFFDNLKDYLKGHYKKGLTEVYTQVSGQTIEDKKSSSAKE